MGEDIVGNIESVVAPVADTLSKTVEAPPPVFTPEFESGLRESLRWQMENPVDHSEIFDKYSKEDLNFLGYGVVPQEKASIENVTKERAHEWFKIVREEVDQARTNGINIIDVSDEDWLKLEEHEVAGHAETAVAVGCAREKLKLGIHFGKELDASGKPTDLIRFQASVLPDSMLDLHPVDRAKIDLAPDAPSWKDTMNFVGEFQQSADRFLERPKETWELLDKFRKTTGMSTVEMIGFLKESIESTIKNRDEAQQRFKEIVGQVSEPSK